MIHIHPAIMLSLKIWGFLSGTAVVLWLSYRFTRPDTEEMAQNGPQPCQSHRPTDDDEDLEEMSWKAHA